MLKSSAAQYSSVVNDTGNSARANVFMYHAIQRSVSYNGSIRLQDLSHEMRGLT